MVPQLPANAKKVQAALAQRYRNDQQRSDAHFRESMKADQMIYDMKYGNMDRGSLSEGIRVSDEEVVRMTTGTSAPAAVPRNGLSPKPRHPGLHRRAAGPG